MIQKLLIANRGEIAVRIIRACREMGIATVAVYSEADQDTQLADEAVCIGPAPSKDSYLNMERILSAALVTGADAVHPGFGFLSENARFAEVCEKCNLTFVGPSSEVIRALGNKQVARNTMVSAGIPVIPGTDHPILDEKEGAKEADRIGYPVIIKAALGGGGKGMRTAWTREEFSQAFLTAKKEADECYNECEASYTLVITYMQAPDVTYRLQGPQNSVNEDGTALPFVFNGDSTAAWFTDTVTIQAPDGYLISRTNSLSSRNWSVSISCTEEGHNEISYYLRNRKSGGITDVLTIYDLKIDK